MIGHLTRTDLTVHRPSTVDDGSGGQTVTFTEVGTIRAQVSQPSTTERAEASQWGVELMHVIHTIADADVERGDELSGDLPSSVPAGRRLRVVATISNSRSTYLRIEAEVAEPEPS
ncbi:MAG: phage head closure protein [Actinobacteria bacterium]|nr:phage head closure protein [Actinomycetota bacterium]